MNLKHVNGHAVLDGPSIQLGAEELYFKYYKEAFEQDSIKKQM